MSSIDILINRQKTVCTNCGLCFWTELQGDCGICLGKHFMNQEQYK
jgi:hypothetical protein